MKTGYTNSTLKKKCKVCGKLTGDYRTFSQSDMTVEVPICKEHWEDKECNLDSIEFKSDLFLKDINKLFK